MITRRSGGMTEFIPSPTEKRDGVIRNHVLDMLANLDERLQRIEEATGLLSELSDGFRETMVRIGSEEAHVCRLNEKLLEAGVTHDDSGNG